MKDNIDINITSDVTDFLEIVALSIAHNPMALAKLAEIFANNAYTAIQRIPYTQMMKYIDGVKKVEDDLGASCRLSKKLFSDQSKREENAMRVYKMVTSVDTTKKIEYLINATRSMLLGLIDVETMFRIFMAIDETLPEDLAYLSSIIERKGPYKGNINILALARSGLMINAGIDSNADVEEQDYLVSSLGYLVDQYSLSLNDDTRLSWYKNMNGPNDDRRFIGMSFNSEEQMNKLIDAKFEETAQGLLEAAKKYEWNGDPIDKILLLSQNLHAVSLLIYATKTDGKLSIYKDLLHTNPLVEIGGYMLPDDDDARESAIWVGAIDVLEEMNMIYCYNWDSKLYRLTDEGWTNAQRYIEENQLNDQELTDPNNILELLK